MSAHGEVNMQLFWDPELKERSSMNLSVCGLTAVVLEPVTKLYLLGDGSGLVAAREVVSKSGRAESAAPTD